MTNSTAASTVNSTANADSTSETVLEAVGSIFSNFEANGLTVLGAVLIVVMILATICFAVWAVSMFAEDSGMRHHVGYFGLVFGILLFPIFLPYFILKSIFHRPIKKIADFKRERDPKYREHLARLRKEDEDFFMDQQARKDASVTGRKLPD